MPFADPSYKKFYDLQLYLRRYAEEAEFREAEAFRKAQWYHREQKKILARYRRKRKKIRAARKEVTKGHVVHCVDAALVAAAHGIIVLY